MTTMYKTETPETTGSGTPANPGRPTADGADETAAVFVPDLIRLPPAGAAGW